MKKILDKILNNALVVLLVANLISYQFILPIRLAVAEDGSTTETAVAASDSGSSGSSSEFDEDTSSGDTSDEDSSDESDLPTTSSGNTENQDTSDDTAGGSTGTTTTNTNTTTTATANDTGGQNSPTDPETLLPAVSTALDSTDPSENDECICENNNNPDPDCENPCPEECQCCIDYCAGIVSQNAAEDSENVAEAVSITGANLIEGAAGNLISGSQPAGAENNLEEEEDENDPDESGEDSSEEEDQTESAESQAVISTENAAAQVAAVNEVNTNIYTENGVQIVENIIGDSAEDIDLISTFENVLEEAQNLNSKNQDFFEKISITNINVAENVENAVIAQADSGANSIENVSGSASIETGDAQASASAVNFINTNITGNNWLMAVINVAGNWAGDLIVPGEGLIKTPSAGMIFDKIVSINLAENIKNFLSSDASTGTNSISSASGSAQIQSGDAVSSASGMNLVNTNIVRNNWFFLMINNSGNWLGRAINWEGGSQNTVYEYNFGSLEGSPEPSKCVSVYNYNSAENVNNTVIASANTGRDSISSAGDASIYAGNASAQASALNFINTNITGNNWMFGVVNNSGNWTGDVIFGYPDLEVSLIADKSAVQPGDSLEFTVHYKNVGQAKCENANLMLSLPDYLSGSGSYDSKDGNNFYWSLGELGSGEEGSFSLKALLASNVPNDIASLEAAAGARTDTEEKEFSNNYDGEKINIIFPQISSNVTIVDGDVISADDSEIILKRSEADKVAIGEIATHQITVKNNGKNILYNLEVKERIKDPSGSKAAEYVWPIAQLKKGQSAFIEYQIYVDPSAKLGTYEHSASSIAYDEVGNKIESEKAEKKVEFVAGAIAGSVSSGNSEIIPPVSDAVESLAPEPEPEVLGASITEKHIPWQWLLALLFLPLAYAIWKKKLYERQKIAGLIRQTASAIFSFFF